MTTITSDLVELYAASDALRLAELVRGGEVTAAELTDVATGVIEVLDPKLNAVVVRTFDDARRRASGSPGDGPFAGVPYLLKDIGSAAAGMSLTAGLEYRKDFVSEYDSEMVSRIKASGLNILGRTNVPENGWCIATEPRFRGSTLNPWNPAVTPGGSSGGSAAAVASRMVPMAEGTDGGGSIRVPASCCGLVGLKPSRGRVSYAPDVDFWFGCVYFFTMTRTVRDTAAFLDATAGNLPGDPYTPPGPGRPWLRCLADRPTPLRVGYTLTSPWGPAFAPEVADAVRETAGLLERLGHHVEEHRFATELEPGWQSYNRVIAVQTVLDFEALARTVGRPVEQPDLAAFNWSQLERGRSLSALEHAADVGVIRLLNQAIQAELAPFDVFLTPTLTQPPRPVGHWDLNEPDFDAYVAKWTDAAFMFAFNVSGQPAISLPAAWTGQGVPIGVQLVGRYGDEATILGVSAQIEQARPWIQRRPPVCAGAT